MSRAEEVDVNALDRIVVGLTFAIEQKVHENATTRSVAEIAVETATQFVANERVDRVVHASTQHHMLKLVEWKIREHLIVQTALAVEASEVKAEGIFAPRDWLIRQVPTTNKIATL